MALTFRSQNTIRYPRYVSDCGVRIVEFAGFPFASVEPVKRILYRFLEIPNHWFECSFDTQVTCDIQISIGYMCRSFQRLANAQTFLRSGRPQDRSNSARTSQSCRLLSDRGWTRVTTHERSASVFLSIHNILKIGDWWLRLQRRAWVCKPRSQVRASGA